MYIFSAILATAAIGIMFYLKYCHIPKLKAKGEYSSYQEETFKEAMSACLLMCVPVVNILAAAVLFLLFCVMGIFYGTKHMTKKIRGEVWP